MARHIYDCSKADSMIRKEVKRGQPVKVRIRAELGFLNEQPPTYFHRKAVYVCFLAERSDGELIDFRRIRWVSTFGNMKRWLMSLSAIKLKNGQDILISTDMLQHTQFITCYVMCDEIGRSTAVSINMMSTLLTGT